MLLLRSQVSNVIPFRQFFFVTFKTALSSCSPTRTCYLSCLWFVCFLNPMTPYYDKIKNLFSYYLVLPLFFETPILYRFNLFHSIPNILNVFYYFPCISVCFCCTLGDVFFVIFHKFLFIVFGSVQSNCLTYPFCFYFQWLFFICIHLLFFKFAWSWFSDFYFLLVCIFFFLKRGREQEGRGTGS